jgi:hypothetical protein
MPADPALTSVDHREALARSALRATPGMTFVELFPHLKRVAPEPIDGRGAISTRLRHALIAWHGLMWFPYLFETPARLYARRNIRWPAVGEFISLAIAAADPALEPLAMRIAQTDPPQMALDGVVRDVVDAHPGRGDIDAAIDVLRGLAAIKEVPPEASLSDAARSTLASAPDIPFGGLMPSLGEADDEIDVRAAGRRFLPRILTSWHGLGWSSYVGETPGAFARRRFASPATVGAFLWLAARRTRS